MCPSRPPARCRTRALDVHEVGVGALHQPLLLVLPLLLLRGRVQQVLRQLWREGGGGTGPLSARPPPAAILVGGDRTGAGTPSPRRWRRPGPTPRARCPPCRPPPAPPFPWGGGRGPAGALRGARGAGPHSQACRRGGSRHRKGAAPEAGAAISATGLPARAEVLWRHLGKGAEGGWAAAILERSPSREGRPRRRRGVVTSPNH